MYKRKKFHGGLKVLLLLLFTMLLGMFSTCYAETNNLTPSNHMTPAIAKEIVDYLCDNNVYSSINSGKQYVMNSYRQMADYEQFANLWNSSGIEEHCDVLEQCIFIARINGNGEPRLFVAFVNNTIGNELPYLLLENGNSSYQRKYFYRDDLGNKINGTGYWISFFDTGTVSIKTDEALTTAGNTIIATGTNYWNLNDNILYYKFLFTYHFPGYIYYSNAWRRNDASTVLEYIPESTEPENPDNPIDTGNTGTITNNSGDKTGQIDLSGIQAGIGNINNSINNQGQAIIENQNQNTEAIVNAVNGANENYWGNENELDGEEQQEEIENNLNVIMKNMSGELTRNEVMQQLERSRSRIFKFLFRRT